MHPGAVTQIMMVVTSLIENISIDLARFKNTFSFFGGTKLEPITRLNKIPSALILSTGFWGITGTS